MPTRATRPPASVSVIVPVGPGSDQLEVCLEALVRCTPPPTEIIVVVDGAGDEIAECAQRYPARVIVGESPAGAAAARNTGARLARSEILLFVDADVRIQPDVVGRVALMLSAGSEPSAVFGSYDDDPAAPTMISRYRNLLHHWVHQHGCERASTFWSGCGAIDRAVFEEVGGFPEIPSLEDIALGTRLLTGGHEIRLDPTLQARHLKRWTFADLVWTDLTKRAIPWSEQMIRQRHLVNDLNVDIRGRLSVILLGVVILGLPASIVVPAAGLVSVAAAIALIGANLPFYRFLARGNGWWFAIRAIPLHWLYYLMCGCGFVIGGVRAIATKGSHEPAPQEKARAA